MSMGKIRASGVPGPGRFRIRGRVTQRGVELANNTEVKQSADMMLAMTDMFVWHLKTLDRDMAKGAIDYNYTAEKVG
jgi:hypothetical protein